MLEFLLADGNTPFVVAIGVVFALAVLEVVTALFGAGLSSLIDSLLPDVDAGIAVDAEADFDAGADTGAPDAGPVGGVLTWLCLGKVPALILLIALLTAFGLSGLMIQWFTQALSGAALPGWFAAIPALAAALPATRFFGLGFAKLAPKEETYVVSDQSFVGRIATITLGVAAAGQPAEARLTDEHGRTHYVRVEPADPAVRFAAGTDVLLRRKDGVVFKAVAAPGSSLPPAATS